MKFITPEDILANVKPKDIALDVNLLLSGNLKLQTLHNQTSKALSEKDLEVYVCKILAKAHYKFIMKTEGDV